MNAYEVLYDEYSQDHDDDPPSAPEFKGEPNRAPITGGVVFGPWLPPKEAKSQDDSLAEQLRETKKKLVVTQIRLQMEMELSETLHSKLQTLHNKLKRAHSEVAASKKEFEDDVETALKRHCVVLERFGVDPKLGRRVDLERL
jgi:molecular chaperone GrpE (heat shock protein)